MLLWKFCLLACLRAVQGASLSCQELSIPIDVSAQNKNLPALNLSSLQDPAALNNLVAGLSSSLAQGQYTLAARYCEPTKQVARRHHTLQVLVHGITYTRDYWSGLVAPGTNPDRDQYSWLLYAAKQGYPTLSVDRLCNGNSSRPQSLAFCQVPLGAESMHTVNQLARAGKFGGRAFGQIIFVGHSYGSLVGNALSAQHPDSVDAYILSGFSGKLIQGGPALLPLPLFQPAAVVCPARFGNLALDPGYVLVTSRSGARTLFYRGSYDEAVFQSDYANRGTTTLGELATVLQGQLSAPKFKGPVFVLNGNNDGIFCEDGPVQALTGVPGNCSKGYSSGVKDLYPSARVFDYHNTPNTGHCLNLHRTAQESFKVAHGFLARVGF